MKITAADEIRIAHEILSVLPAGSATRLCSDDADSVRFAVSGRGKLRAVVFSRASLHRLAGDPAGPVKIEYLQRDLLSSRRSEFRYPRHSRIVRKSSRAMRAAALAVAALAR